MKLSKKDRKELLMKRKAKEKKNFDLAQKCKQIWEVLRREDCSKSHKIELIDKIMKLVGDRFKELVKAHDTVRVIECIIAHGTDEQRAKLFDQFKDCIVELSKTKYAKYFVMRMLKYGSKEERNFIIRSFYGHVKELMKHALASTVLEYAYNEFADVKQRNMLVQEYYGTEFSLFKDERKSSFAQVLATVTDDQRKKIMDEMKEELIRLVEKGSIKHSITHYLLREFFKHADDASKKELIGLIRESIVEILHTKDGSRVAMYCLWNSDTKDRKVLLKTFKGLSTKIAMEEHGHLVLLSVFDVVDDTKLIEKVIISELVSQENVKELVNNLHGRKVYEYLMSPRNPKYFHKDVVAILSGGDKNPYSKKDQQVRWNELRNMAGPKLLDMVKENAATILESGQSGLMLYEIILNVSGDRIGALRAMVETLKEKGAWKKSDPNVAGSEHFIEKGCVTAILKKFMSLDTLLGEEITPTFPNMLLTGLDKDILLSYVNCNRGCFFLLSILESSDTWAREQLAGMLKNYPALKAQESKGAQMLKEKIESGNMAKRVKREKAPT